MNDADSLRPGTTIHQTINKDGIPLTNTIYIFHKPCDLSALQNVDLNNATLHFSGYYGPKALNKMNLRGATVFINDTSLGK